MINLLDLMGGHFHDKIVELVKEGKKFYTVNDNLNCKTTVKNMRVDHRNKQHNWFVSIIVFERIDFSYLDNVIPLGDVQNISNENYLLTPEEAKKLQSDFLWGEPRILQASSICTSQEASATTHYAPVH